MLCLVAKTMMCGRTQLTMPQVGPPPLEMLDRPPLWNIGKLYM